MANDFSHDLHCKALWRFESGALISDSVGSNDLTNSGMDQEVALMKEGQGSVYADSVSDKLYVENVDLDSDFPFKSEESKQISACLWLRYNDLVTSTPGNESRTFFLYITRKEKYISLGIKYADNVNAIETVSIESPISPDTWYHIGVTFDDLDGSYRIRVWDDNAKEIFGEITGNFSNNIYLSDNNFSIGDYYNNSMIGYYDEVVIFDDILTDDEIDQIRSGIYPGVVLIDIISFSEEVIEEHSSEDNLTDIIKFYDILDFYDFIHLIETVQFVEEIGIIEIIEGLELLDQIQFLDYMDTFSQVDYFVSWRCRTKIPSLGYGGSAYGDGISYGDGTATDIVQYKIEVYNGVSKSREETLNISDQSDPDTTYIYTVAMNILDHGYYVPNLTFKVYQIDNNGKISPANIIDVIQF